MFQEEEDASNEWVQGMLHSRCQLEDELRSCLGIFLWMTLDVCSHLTTPCMWKFLFVFMERGGQTWDRMWTFNNLCCSQNLSFSVFLTILVIFNCFYFMHLSVFLVCMFLYHAHALCPWSSEECVRYHETGILDGCEPPCGWWELHPGSLQEQWPSLTTEPCLQLPIQVDFTVNGTQ